MKKNLFILFTTFIYFSVFAQDKPHKTIVALSGQTIRVYAGVPNNLQIMAENVPDNELYVTTTDGELTKRNGNYEYTVKKPRGGIVWFKLFHIKNGDTLLLASKYVFQEKLKPYIYLLPGEYTRKNKYIPKKTLCFTKGIRVGSEALKLYGIKSEVHSAEVQIRTQKKSKIFLLQGGKFSPELHVALTKLQEGDTILIHKVVAQCGETVFDRIEPFKLPVKILDKNFDCWNMQHMQEIRKVKKP